MNITKLHILVLIEKYKKVTDVAAELGLKQPTVTFHMKSLESELGTALFQYRSGRVLLTEAGRTLYQYAVKMVYLNAEAERSIKQFTSPSDGELELVAGYIPGTYLLPKMISPFMKQYPGSKLSLSIQEDSLLREQLRLQEVQFALLHNMDTSDKSFNYQQLVSEEAVLIYAPGHPFDENPPVTAEQVASQPWVQHAEGSTLRIIADKWAKLNHVRLWNRTELNSPETLKALVSQGDSVGIFSKAGIEAELSLGRLKYTSLPGVQTEFGRFMLAWRKDYILSALQQAFVNGIIDIQ
ncbi:MAG: LysR family transcriptional regulator [Paenibacillus sp.]|nr:LysR family transcriptional regulator [Paenibacillus sp.]